MLFTTQLANAEVAAAYTNVCKADVATAMKLNCQALK